MLMIPCLPVSARAHDQQQQLSIWGEACDDDVSDVTDKLGVLIYEIGELEDQFVDRYDQYRVTIKSIRNIEASVQPSRDRKSPTIELFDPSTLRLYQASKRSPIRLHSSSTRSQTARRLSFSSKSLSVPRPSPSSQRRSCPISPARSSRLLSTTSSTLSVSTPRSSPLLPATESTFLSWSTTPQSPQARPETPTTDTRPARPSSKTARTHSPIGSNKTLPSAPSSLPAPALCLNAARTAIKVRPSTSLVRTPQWRTVRADFGSQLASTRMRTSTRRMKRKSQVRSPPTARAEVVRRRGLPLRKWSINTCSDWGSDARCWGRCKYTLKLRGGCNIERNQAWRPWRDDLDDGRVAVLLMVLVSCGGLFA